MEQFIIDRIKALPKIQSIVPNSIPVISFGDFRKCKVATLGINPSKNEFIINNGVKRFTDLSDIGISNREDISINQAEQVFLSCCNYFHVNPYRRWFDRLENHILQKLNVSYYNGTACHLDLIQWSTDPIWRNLDYNNQQLLLNDDFPFLLKQLEKSNIDTLIINGLTAHQVFFNKINHHNFTYDNIICDNKNGRIIDTCIHIENKEIRVMAYNSNLQSTVGLTNNMRHEIGHWISNRLS